MIQNSLAGSYGSALVCPDYKIYASKPSLFNGAALEQISRDLAKALPSLKISDYFKAKPEIASNSDLVIVSEDNNGEAIGLLTSKWYSAGSFEFLHIMTIFIADRYQGTKLFKRMWQVHFEELSRSDRGFPSIFSLKTYNPISCSLLRRVAGKAKAYFYPLIDVDHPRWMTQQVIEIANSIETGTSEVFTERDVHSPELGSTTAQLRASLDTRTGVIAGGGNLVPIDFYPRLPKSAKPDIMSHFSESLTPEDRLLCCLFCPETSMKQSILEQFGARVC